MASSPAKSKKPRNKPPKGRPAGTSAISQPAVEDASSSHTFSSFSPQGDLFAFLSLAVDKHRLRVYDTTTGQAVAEHVVDSARVSSICWAHYDTAAHGENEPRRKRKRKNQQGDTASTKLPPPGVILGLTNGSLVLYSPAHGKVVKSISHTSSTAAITSVAVDVSEGSEATHAWTSGADGVIRLWDLHEKDLVDQWKGDERIPYSCLSVRPSASEESEDAELLGANYSIQLLSASRSANIAGETKKLQKVSGFTGHASLVKALQWDSRSRFLSSAEADRFIYLWDVPETTGSEGKVAASIPLESEVRATALSIPPSTTSSSKPQTLLAVSASGRISIFPLPSDLTSFTPSKKVKVPTLTPSSTISAAPSKKGGDATRAQIISAGFVAGSVGKVRVARLAGGVKPTFDVVEYLDAEGEFLPEVSLTPITASTALRSSAQTTTGIAPQRYTESSSTAVRSGIELGQDASMDDLATRDIEGELDADLAELSLGQRLTALSGTDGIPQRASESDDEVEAKASKTTPTDGTPLQTVPASSLTRTLIQALHSSDSGLLETCLAHTNAALIQNTVQRLPSQLAVPLITACVERLGRGKRAGRGKGGGAGAGAQRGTGLVRWVRAVLLVHGGYLLTIPDLVARLSGLHATVTSRLALQQSLLSLSGRLDMVISQIELRSSTAPAPLPVPQSTKSKGKQKKQPQKQVARYVEGESEDEEADDMNVEVESGDDAGSVEDVELGGSDEEEDDEEEEEDEEEDEEDSEENDEEENDSDDSDAGGFKMNGFIDDEAEEYSSDGDEDESE
ncbi:WD40-repeat-containing domain protein [Irpex rosettiformis]|uniref:WD40-repeat-containing domain protein n=1 Tax=Irpex rosettiformis TaxID=378272 RepID=A0ACB8U7U6_9APHY|nr:WD40-repeat-containing domain protein [Irpex rosettiformis]